MNRSVLSWAKYYVNERGWSVIPLKYGGKEPTVSEWRTYTERLPTSVELDYWFGGDTKSNIAVVTGDISNLIVVDFDDEESTRQFSHKVFSEGYSEWYLTPVVATANGYHWYLRPKENGTRTSSFIMNDKKHHIKAYNSYVVAPPSVHPSGLYYEFISDTDFMDPTIASVVDVVGVIENMGAEFTSKGQSDKPINWASELCETISQGGRNDAAAQICGLLINKFPYDPGFIYGMMYAWNNEYCEPPLELRELEYLVEQEYRRYGPGS